MKFVPLMAFDSLEFLNFRVTVRREKCVHCHRVGYIVCHGFLRGSSEDGCASSIRGQRFFCSNRHASAGCGRTFSVHWSSIIPFCFLRTQALFAFIQALIQAKGCVHRAWLTSRFPLSLNSAYR